MFRATSLHNVLLRLSHTVFNFFNILNLFLMSYAFYRKFQKMAILAANKDIYMQDGLQLFNCIIFDAKKLLKPLKNKLECRGGGDHRVRLHFNTQKYENEWWTFYELSSKKYENIYLYVLRLLNTMQYIIDTICNQNTEQWWYMPIGVSIDYDI